MLDVSRRLVEIATRQFASGQLNVPDLTQGLSSVTANGHFIDWNDFATLFERAEEAAGGPSRLAALSETAAVRALPEGAGLMAIAPDLVWGAQLVNELADATFFTHVRYPTMRQTGERTLCLSLRLDRSRGQRDSPSFLRAMEGTLRASSGFAGLPAATVKAEIRPFVAHYEVVLPKSRGTVAEHSGESAVKAGFLRQCQLTLRRARHGMLDLREVELRARDAETFAALSASVAESLQSHERATFPQAAAVAIQQVLRCQRVVLRRPSSASNAVLAAVGSPLSGLHVVELEAASGSLRIEADVARDSPAARAIDRLAPWLAAVCADRPSPEAATTVTSDWAAKRQTELARLWGLTPRQQQVAWLVVSGESNKSISKALRCAEGTVELHVHAVLQKSGAESRTGLTAHFFRGR